MFTKLVPVNKDQHADLKVKPIAGFGFASKFHIASLMVHEFARAAAVYPIVFIEDKSKDEFRPVVMLGLDEGENLFVAEDGKWQASYVPAIIRRYPFALASTGEEGQFTVCVDEDSEFVDRKEGNAMFDEQGQPTQVIENVKRYLSELQQMEVFTNEFCKFMAGHNLFTPLNMRVRQNEQMKNITGCYVVNEERLNNLSDSTFLELKKRRYLAPVFAHLTSLSQIERLAMLKDGVTGLTKTDSDAESKVH
ncbi:MAG: SapC family protein [Marinobacter sp.]|nr:SapC family protein [Marinobacter sp.]